MNTHTSPLSRTALIFDLDGTLLDTLEDIARAGNAVLQAHGYPCHPLDAYRGFVGYGFRHLLAAALPETVSLPDDQLDTLVAEARAWYGDHLWPHTQPYAGIPEALRCLAQEGHALAVLSNKPHELTVPLIRHFFADIPLEPVLGGRDGFPLKPDPTVPLDVLRTLHVSAAQAFYVGDSMVDVLTAHNAGMRAIGVAWGFAGADAMRQAQAEHVITTADALPALAAL